MALSTEPPPTAPPPPPPVIPQRNRRSWLGTRRRKLVAAVVVLGALGLLLGEGLSNATVYFKTANQAVADRQALGSRPFRIEGTVADDVVTHPGGRITFSIYANGVSVDIVDTSLPPQLFKPGIPVVLQGHWQGSVYAANLIMVKHTSNYVAAHPNRLKPQTPPPGATTPAAPAKG